MYKRKTYFWGLPTITAQICSTAVKRHCTDCYEIWVLNRPWNLLYKNVGPREIFKGPVLGNGKRFWGRSNALMQLMYRGFTNSFMKVTSRHFFTLFRPFLWQKPLSEIGVTKCPNKVQIMPCAWYLSRKKKSCCPCKIDRGTADLVGSFILLFHC